jgi:hypothetical protein
VATHAAALGTSLPYARRPLSARCAHHSALCPWPCAPGLPHPSPAQPHPSPSQPPAASASTRRSMPGRLAARRCDRHRRRCADGVVDHARCAEGGRARGARR